MITHGGRLPAETSRFFGRSREAAAIADALAESRLVTLTGPGGVGKSRLALRAAAGLTEAFPDGMRLAELSGALDADDVLRVVAAATGVAGASFPSAALSGQLAGRQLLILETCDRVVDACAAVVNAVLRGADGPVVLVTSRQPLDLPGEVVFRIPPLDVGPDGGDAVALFADRAAAAVPGFSVTPQNLARVIALCGLLDGIPLAIEFAALRLRAVGLDELLTRLPGRLRQLGSGRRAEPRQRSLQASVDWSYDLCTPAERLLWARLSVFGGGFDLAAAEAVCGPSGSAADPADAYDVLDTLAGLVDKSVVLRVDEPDASGEAQYRLLEVVREHGAALADEADMAERAARLRAHRERRGTPGPPAGTPLVGAPPSGTPAVGAPSVATAAGGTATAAQVPPAAPAPGGDISSRPGLASGPRPSGTSPAAPSSPGALASRPWSPGEPESGPRPGRLAPGTPSSGTPSGTPASGTLSSGELAPGTPPPGGVASGAPSGEPESETAGPQPAAPAGAAAAVPSAAAVAAAAEERAARWRQLTAREREVASLVARGLTNRDIAARLVVSKRTVDAHIEHILAKLAYSSRVQIAALAAEERDAEDQAGAGPPGEPDQARPVPAPRASGEAAGSGGAKSSHT